MSIQQLNNNFEKSFVQSTTNNNKQHIERLQQPNSSSENMQQQMSNGSLQNTTESGNIRLNQRSNGISKHQKNEKEITKNEKKQNYEIKEKENFIKVEQTEQSEIEHEKIETENEEQKNSIDTTDKENEVTIKLEHSNTTDDDPSINESQYSYDNINKMAKSHSESSDDKLGNNDINQDNDINSTPINNGKIEGEDIENIEDNKSDEITSDMELIEEESDISQYKNDDFIDYLNEIENLQDILLKLMEIRHKSHYIDLREDFQQLHTNIAIWMIQYISTPHNTSNSQLNLDDLKILSQINDYITDHCRNSVHHQSSLAIAKAAQKVYCNNSNLDINNILEITNNACIDCTHCTDTVKQHLDKCICEILQTAYNNDKFKLIQFTLLLHQTHHLILKHTLNITKKRTTEPIMHQCIEMLMQQIPNIDTNQDLHHLNLKFLCKILKIAHISFQDKYQCKKHKNALQVIYDQLQNQINNTSNDWEIGNLQKSIQYLCEALDIPIEHIKIDKQDIYQYVQIAKTNGNNYLPQIKEKIDSMPDNE